MGKRRCRAYVMDEEYVVLDELAFDNTFDGIRSLLDRGCGVEYRAVIESTGKLWMRIYDILEDHGVEVKL